jgi:Domain of unknown function (DUF4386)
MTNTIDDAQRNWAKVVGIAYLFVIIPAFFAEFYVFNRLSVTGDALTTAANIVANERLFRLGTAANFLVFAADVFLIAGLYIVLERVNRNLALVAVFFRMLETGMLLIAALNDLDVVRILTADYMQVFEPDRLAAMARLSIGAHGSAYNLGLLMFGFGSPVFCWLWLKSAYIPKVLAGWGIFASVVVAICTFTFIVFPEAGKVVTVAFYGGPILLFEIGIGLLLVIKGISPPRSGHADDERRGAVLPMRKQPA